jgi:hypothetical protein
LKGLVRGTCLVAASMIAAAVPAVAGAETLYVRGGGGNAGAPCTEAEPCNLAKGVNKAEEAGGGAVVLLPGPAFTPTRTVIVAGPIDIGGQAGSARPTILAPSSEGVLIVEDGAHLHDANLVNDQNPSGALGIHGGSAERIMAEDVGAPACFVTSGSIRDGICVGGPAGIVAGALTPSSTVELRNVDAIGGHAGISVISPFDADENRVEAVNTIALAYEPGGHDIVAGDSPHEGVARVDLTHSDYLTVETAEATDSITPPGTAGNLTERPAFADSAAGDYHQLSTSPTVDAGLTEPANGDLDLDGNPRALSAHPTCTSNAGPTDIGAYEYVAAIPPCVAQPDQGGGDQTAPPPPPARPGTTLKKAKIDKSKGTATFTFSGTGTVSGYKCELVRPAPKGAKKAKGKKPAKSTFTACKSPKTYKHLKPGKYTFKVEATGPGGTDLTPATRTFTIKGGAR